MVSVIVIAALAAAGFWFRADFKYRYYKEQSELYQELYENERDDRIDYEVELSFTRVQLEDSRATVGRMIANNAQQWAAKTANRPN
jgi:hypothetical protein